MKVKSFLLFALTASQTGFGIVGVDLLTCQSAGFFKSKCLINESQLFPRASYQSSGGGSTDVHTQVAISYVFPCQGHLMKVGVSSNEQNAEFAYNGSSMLLHGVGPFSLRNFSPGTEGMTYKAAVNNDCQLKITSLARDLSDISIQLLKEKIEGMKALNQVLGKVRESKSLFTSLASVLSSLDAQGIHDVLTTVRDEAVSLQLSATSSAARDAVADAIDEIDLALDLNPAVTPASDLRNRASHILTALDVQANGVLLGVQQSVSAKYQDGTAMLGYASPSTKQVYQPQLDAQRDQ